MSVAKYLLSLCSIAGFLVLPARAGRSRPHLLGQLPDQFYFLGIVRSSVLAEDVMKPDRGLGGVSFIPRIPGIDGLRLSVYKAPVVRSDLFFFQQRQNRGECTASRARHVFGANDRAAKATQRVNATLHFIRRFITVKGNDVGVLQLKAGHLTQFVVPRPVIFPDAAGQRL